MCIAILASCGKGGKEETTSDIPNEGTTTGKAEDKTTAGTTELQETTVLEEIPTDVTSEATTADKNEDKTTDSTTELRETTVLEEMPTDVTSEGTTVEKNEDQTTEGTTEIDRPAVPEETAEIDRPAVPEGTTEIDRPAIPEETAEIEETTAIVETPDEEIVLDDDDGELILMADRLANGVQTYYEHGGRDFFVVENTNMMLNFAVSSNYDNQVSSLTDKSGNAYINDTMDVFVRMTDGSTYYSSGAMTSASTNIYRLGYYYYENRIENLSFVGRSNIDASIVCNHMAAAANDHLSVVSQNSAQNVVVMKVENSVDPFFMINNINMSADKYKYVEITLKANSGISSSAGIYVIAGSKNGYNAEQQTSFNIIPDGKYHTYVVALGGLPDYTGSLKGVRFDIGGTKGATFEVGGVRMLGMNYTAPDNLSLCRSFLSYSDKLHHVIQVAASKQTSNVAEVGMLTTIPTDRVKQLVVKDKNGLHYDLAEAIDWASTEYVGFLIDGVGAFGYILPYDASGGNIKVVKNGQNYLVEQTKSVKNNTIKPSSQGSENSNDFFMGQRIYTDTEKTLDTFIYEAECERHPLTEENFIIKGKIISDANFAGYNALRGCYVLNITKSTHFSEAYYNYPNAQFGVEFIVKGDDKDRTVYLMTASPNGGLECAVLLDEKQMLLPIPIEVCKNFKGDGENTIFMLDDTAYGEAIVPLIVKASSEDTFTFLNLYQNWGLFPLKQLSSIQFFQPYYHLSTGVTETNCIVPYSSEGILLPDHRAMSAPLWETQPQHTNSGYHNFVKYYLPNGTLVTSQHVQTDISSYGPTYSDMTDVMITTDEKIKFTYNHMEMPQTDENRTYYQIKIDVLEDLTIESFREDFCIYSVGSNDVTGYYTQVGYLDENNVSRVVNANLTDTAVEYRLGSKFPYFTFMNMAGYSNSTGYCNVSILVYDAEAVINGEETECRFVLRNTKGVLTLTLDLDKVELKSGDSITINGILLPWGSQKSVYDGSNGLAPDQNLRNVIKDSFVDPLKATAKENCETVSYSDGIFLPELLTTNGKSATFTLSGGNNNVAVRIYGFKTLTVPYVEEYVNGSWVEYKLSSANAPDAYGYGFEYDGYSVYYDGDKTYSYSFVASLNNGAPRTFRITVDGEFKGWENGSSGGNESFTDEKGTEKLTVYVSPNDVCNLTGIIGCKARVFGDDEYYVRFTAQGAPESYAIFYTDPTGSVATGKYMVVKYRVPKTVTSMASSFELFVSTQNEEPTGNGRFVSPKIAHDGQWHIMVLDMTQSATFTSKNGKYYAKHARLDMINGQYGVNTYVDIAYLGLTDELSDLDELMQNAATVTLVDANGAATRLDPQ